MTEDAIWFAATEPDAGRELWKIDLSEVHVDVFLVQARKPASARATLTRTKSRAFWSSVLFRAIATR